MARTKQVGSEQTRARVVQLLRRRERTVEELARSVGVTPNAIRSQLTALERDGTVEIRGQRPGRRRPSVLYGITADAETRLSRAYVPVLGELLRELSGRLSPPELDQVLHAVGQRLAGGSSPPAAGWEAAEAASAALNELGAVTEVERVETSQGALRPVIRGHACPLADAVRHQPLTCSAVRGLVARLTGMEVRQCCEHGERPRCCFELAPPADAA